MPYRKFHFSPGEIYHIFNRSIARQPIFLNTRDYQRALDVLYFYRYLKPRLRYSYYNRLPQDQKSGFLDELRRKNKKQIQLFAYCLMPNHVHILAKEQENKGISSFMRNFQDSYAKYFNTKSKRSGSLFQSMFKAVRIETDEQLLHVCRYIHLNPLTSYIIRDPQDLETYEWCSFKDYLNNKNSDLVEKDLILANFSTIDSFKEFTLDRVEYQRQLETIKHLMLE